MSMPHLPEELAPYITADENGLKLKNNAPKHIEIIFSKWKKEIDEPTIEVK